MSGTQLIPQGSGSIPLTENDLKKDQIRAGLIGKIFGSNEYVTIYIAASVAILCIAAGFIITVFLKDAELGMGKKDIWAILSPLITASLGYIFGKKI